MKIGLYVDVANLSANGGYGMRYDVLRDFAARGSGEPIRLNAYVVYDARRAQTDREYRNAQESFFSALRGFGYKVIVKEFKWYRDEAGGEYAKANADLVMAVDALLQSENLDRVLLATGDGDFVEVVRALQNRGCRVEVVAFESIALALKREADMFMSGFLIPGVLPLPSQDSQKRWGDEGSRVRGVCYNFFHDKKYGFMRYVREIGAGVCNTDTRHQDSSWGSAFVLKTEFRDFDVGRLPDVEEVFEFTLAKSEKGLQATHVAQVGAPLPASEPPDRAFVSGGNSSNAH